MKWAVVFLLAVVLIAPVYASAPNLEQQIAHEINEYRASNGLSPLIYDKGIERVAVEHANDLAEFDLLQHETPGTNVDAPLRGSLNGYSYCGDTESIEKFITANKLIYEYNQGLYHDASYLNELIRSVNQDIMNQKIAIGFTENIAGVKSNSDITQNVFDGWHNSVEHNKAMLGVSEKIGIGIAHDFDNDRIVIVANFC